MKRSMALQMSLDMHWHAAVVMGGHAVLEIMLTSTSVVYTTTSYSTNTTTTTAATTTTLEVMRTSTIGHTLLPLLLLVALLLR